MRFKFFSKGGIPFFKKYCAAEAFDLSHMELT